MSWTSSIQAAERVTRSMAIQVARVNGKKKPSQKRNATPTRAELLAQIQQLTTARDQYKSWWEQSVARCTELETGIARLAKSKGLDRRNINGRPVGSASELARTWGVKPDRVCKWKGESRVTAAGTDTKGRALYYLDESKPAPKQRGKRK